VRDFSRFISRRRRRVPAHSLPCIIRIMGTKYYIPLGKFYPFNRKALRDRRDIAVL
jgi:hypothetical protein